MAPSVHSPGFYVIGAKGYMLFEEAQLPEPLAWRPARPGDDGFQAILYRSTRDDLLSMVAEPAVIETLLALQYQARQAVLRSSYPQARYLIVERTGEPLGGLVLDLDGESLRLVDIAFMPAARGLGHGAQVVRALQDMAARLRLPLTLSVYRSNGVARRLYDRLGFQSVGGDAMSEHRVWQPPA